MIRALAIAVIGFAGATWLQSRVGPLPEIHDHDSSEVRLPAAALRAASVGYAAVLSDWYWLEAIQYFGTPSNAAVHYRGLARYLQIASDLDPEFDYLYQFAGEALPVPDQEKKGWHNTAAAIELLEKGMRSQSTRWQIPFTLAYLLYTFRGDYERAGHYLEQAAVRPRAPTYLSGFAAKLLAQGGNLDTAIEFAQAQLAQIVDQRTRDELAERLKALYLQRDLLHLNEAAQARLAVGQPLDRVEDLVGFAGLSAIPPEPFGGTFAISGTRVVSSDDEKLLHVFIHPDDKGRPLQPYAD